MGLGRTTERGDSFVYFRDGFEIDFKFFTLSDASSVFMAEMTEIREAMEYVIEGGHGSTQIVSDSRSSLMALESTCEKRSFIKEIKRKIKFHENKIFLCWIKVHKGYMGNEQIS
ncbi:hypothetical protein AVEN_207603-1 [Araneus ventricosus]|uniref:Uncharacterized protein n=1 Tax=Araneus ventricosus TaxID=182803 RepID=A0A4Y2W9Z1_ARAVE|nr:hypothetical protein AVEN_207603-1 [Araneus ventricosus]